MTRRNRASLPTLEGEALKSAVVSSMGRIKLVIDDWSVLRRWYPEVANDPRFLPFILYYLRRKGVTALIVESRAVEHSSFDLEDRDLPLQVDRRLYTWRFPFYGKTNVAIMAVPPLSMSRSTSIREVRPVQSDPFNYDKVEVDPHFEMYQLEKGTLPTRIPLRVQPVQSNGG